jgi:hypothetical protein
MAPPGQLTLAPARDARPAGSTPLEFVLKIVVDDLDALQADIATRLSVVGTVEAPALSADPLLIEEGYMQLLDPVPDEVETWHMHYSLPLVAVDGRRFQFEGIKVDEHSKVIEGGGDYRAINPLGFVPALCLNDNSVITEVAAIVQYIADKAPAKKLAPPNGTVERVLARGIRAALE